MSSSATPSLTADAGAAARAQFYRPQPQRFPLPATPNGWYKLLYSDELPVGGVLTLKYFGRELVAYRGTDGIARVVDAYCRHLGAHLGHGGTVEGGNLVCPFHGWHWNGGTGRCEHIPNCEVRPRNVVLPHWQVVEANDYIAIWYHQGGALPSFDVPRFPELLDADYRLYRREKWTLSVHIQDIYENIVDTAHFSYMHKMDISKVNWEPVGDAASPVVRLTIDMKRDNSPQDDVGGGTKIESFLYGPGLQITRIRGRLTGVSVNSLTPLGDDRVQVTHAYYVDRKSTASLEEIKAFWDYYVEDHTPDFMVWNHKVHLPEPALVKTDGDIHRFRRWFSQFYSA